MHGALLCLPAAHMVLGGHFPLPCTHVTPWGALAIAGLGYLHMARWRACCRHARVSGCMSACNETCMAHAEPEMQEEVSEYISEPRASCNLTSTSTHAVSWSLRTCVLLDICVRSWGALAWLSWYCSWSHKHIEHSTNPVCVVKAVHFLLCRPGSELDLCMLLHACILSLEVVNTLVAFI